MKKSAVILCALVFLTVCARAEMKEIKNVYVNDEKVEFSVPPYIKDGSQFFELVPVIEKMGGTVAEKDGKLTVSGENTGYFVLDPEKKEVTKYDDPSFSGNELAADWSDGIEVAGGKVMISRFLLKVMSHANTKILDDSLYIYTKDFERRDIPATFEEAFAQLSAMMKDEEIESFRAAPRDEVAEKYRNIVMWIAGNWVSPADSRIAKLYKDSGISEPIAIAEDILLKFHDSLNLSQSPVPSPSAIAPSPSPSSSPSAPPTSEGPADAQNSGIYTAAGAVLVLLGVIAAVLLFKKNKK